MFEKLFVEYRSLFFNFQTSDTLNSHQLTINTIYYKNHLLFRSDIRYCDAREYANGFRLKVESNQVQTMIQVQMILNWNVPMAPMFNKIMEEIGDHGYLHIYDYIHIIYMFHMIYIGTGIVSIKFICWNWRWWNYRGCWRRIWN